MKATTLALFASALLASGCATEFALISVDKQEGGAEGDSTKVEVVKVEASTDDYSICWKDLGFMGLVIEQFGLGSMECEPSQDEQSP